MKKLLLILTLLFSVMFSSTPYADWTEVSKNIGGDVFFIDYERIKKHDGYVYFWYLTNYLQPSSSGIWSVKIYRQADCKLFRSKSLSWSFHQEPMGRGTGILDNTPDKEWGYPTPDSSFEALLESVCSR